MKVKIDNSSVNKDMDMLRSSFQKVWKWGLSVTGLLIVGILLGCGLYAMIGEDGPFMLFLGAFFGCLTTFIFLLEMDLNTIGVKFTQIVRQSIPVIVRIFSGCIIGVLLLYATNATIYVLLQPLLGMVAIALHVGLTVMIVFIIGNYLYQWMKETKENVKRQSQY